MRSAICLPLASIEAVRPVFMIVMGIFLLLIAWRLSKVTSGWSARLIVGGAFLLAFGYAVMMPLYDAGAIEHYGPLKKHYHGSAATALAWYTLKLVLMNAGWLAFGLGLALHAKVFTPPTPARKVPPPTLTSHESIA